MLVLALALALAALAGCAPGGSASATPTATMMPTATPTATALPQPKLLYQADWSHGAGGWALPAGWHVTNGQLVNDGTSDAAAIAPFTVSVPNYTIEARIHMLEVTSPTGVADTYFGLGAQDDSGKLLCAGEATGIWKASPWHSDSTLSTTGDYPDGAKVWENIVGVNPKTYKLAITGSTVQYFPGNVSIGGLTAPYVLSPARPMLIASSVRLAIMSFAVYQT